MNNYLNQDKSNLKNFCLLLTTGKGKARLIGRAMGGGLAGSVPGILAGKLANQG